MFLWNLCEQSTVANRHRILWIQKGRNHQHRCCNLCSDSNQPNHCFSALLCALFCVSITTLYSMSVCVLTLPPVNKTLHFHLAHFYVCFVTSWQRWMNTSYSCDNSAKEFIYKFAVKLYIKSKHTAASLLSPFAVVAVFHSASRRPKSTQPW